MPTTEEILNDVYVEADSALRVKQAQAVIRAVTDSTTAIAADAEAIVEINKATGTTFTVPPNASVAFPVGTMITVAQVGAGAITLTQGAGVTIRVDATFTLVTAGQWSVVHLYKRATNEWVATGNLVPA